MISLVFILIVAVSLGTRFTYLVVRPFVGLGIGAMALMMVGFTAPKLTDDGLKEAARWEAFKRYLKNMGVKDAAKVQSKFSRLLPYAVAFGLEKDVIEKFRAANTPAPEWWGKPEENISFDHSHAYSWVGNPSPDIPKKPKKQKAAFDGLARRQKRPLKEPCLSI